MEGRLGRCLAVCVAVLAFTGVPAFCWTNETNHGGANVTISTNTTWHGRHYNIGTLTVNSGVTLFVTAYDAVGNESAQSSPAAVVTTSSAGGAGQKGVVGGIGLNNIGLLVRLWGQFIYVDASSFLLDDGGWAPVNCIVPPDVTIDPDWQYVGVTGISSCYKSGDELIRLLKVRGASDITAY